MTIARRRCVTALLAVAALLPVSVAARAQEVRVMTSGGVEAEIGFQQVSELLGIKGIDYAGPLPAEVQRITSFSAGVTTAAGNPAGARALIAIFNTPEGARMLTKYGLEPITSR